MKPNVIHPCEKEPRLSVRRPVLIDNEFKAGVLLENVGGATDDKWLVSTLSESPLGNADVDLIGAACRALVVYCKREGIHWEGTTK
jgi:hypothetical protein